MATPVRQVLLHLQFLFACCKLHRATMTVAQGARLHPSRGTLSELASVDLLCSTMVQGVGWPCDDASTCPCVQAPTPTRRVKRGSQGVDRRGGSQGVDRAAERERKRQEAEERKQQQVCKAHPFEALTVTLPCACCALLQRQPGRQQGCQAGVWAWK